MKDRTGKVGLTLHVDSGFLESWLPPAYRATSMRRYRLQALIIYLFDLESWLEEVHIHEICCMVSGVVPWELWLVMAHQ